MIETPESFGISWEQITIAGICLFVLLVAGFLALRGGRKRRAARHAPHEATFPYAPGDAPPMEREPLPLEPRAEPLLTPTAKTAPVAESNLRQEYQALSAAYAQTAQTVKSLKADIDELRHVYVVAERRLEEAEKRILELNGSAAAGPSPGPARKKPSGSAAPSAATDDPTVLRARRAIEQLGRD